jgi:hypothetical protein
VGFASLVFSRLTSKTIVLRPWFACGGVAAMAILLVPGICDPGHAEEGGPVMNHPSILVLADRYLPELADACQPTIVSNGLIQPFLEWTFAERYGCLRQAEINMGWAKNASDQAGFDTWLRTTRSDKLVYVEVTGQPSFDSGWPPEDPQWMRRRLAGQKRFFLVRRWQLPEFGDAAVSIWQRDNNPQASR